MTGSHTPNLGLYKPAVNENGYAALVNANFDILDTSAGEFGGWDGYLLNQINPGDRTFTLTAAPPSLFNSHDIALVIDPGTNAEARAAKTLSSATFTIPDDAHAFRITHSAGARVKFAGPGQLTPFMFGAKADNGTTDDWRACQRCYCETGSFAGTGSMYFIRQPFYHGALGAQGIATNLNLRADGDWTPTKQPGYQSMAKSARQFGDFTATASNNRIIFTDGLPGGLGTGVGKEIAFNNPYGETLPGGIVSGCIYQVESLGANYVTLKHLLATGTPGTTVDITVDGGGTYWTNMDSLVHINVTGYRFNQYLADVGGWSILPQQRSTIIGGQFECFSTHTTARTVHQLDVGGTEPGGQQGNFFDISFVTGDKGPGLITSGTGYSFGGILAFVGSGAAGPALICSGQQHRFDGLWFETYSVTGMTFGNSGGAADAISIGNILNSCPTTAYVFTDETVEGASFTIDKIRSANGSTKLFKRAGGYDITGWDGSGAHHTNIGDTRYTVGPLHQISGGNGLSLARQSHYVNVWRSGSEGATLTLSYQYEQYAVDTGTTPLTVVIPDPIGLDNSEFAITRVAGSSSYTINPPGATTIMDDAGLFQTTVTITDNLPRRYRPVYPGFVLAWARA